MPTLPPNLLQQPHIPNNHPLIHRLQHIINRQRSPHRSSHRLHLHPGPPKTTHRRQNPHTPMIIRARARRPVQLHAHLHPRDPDARVTQRNQVGRLLSGHDAGDAGDAEDVAFVGALAFAEEGPGAGVGEGDRAGCGGDAFGFGFGGDLGHVHRLRWGEVWEVGVGGGWEGVGFGGFVGFIRVGVL